MTQTDSSHSQTALWVMMLGNFVIGTGILLPAGLLNDLTASFGISYARAGLLMLVGGLVVGVGAPVFAALTYGIERRVLLTAALLLFALGHLGSALAQDFNTQLIIRAATVIGAAVFTPQAAATVGLLVPLEKRAGAIAFIFIGWSAASVGGIPLGGYLSSMFDWRLVYLVMAGFAFCVAIGIWFVVRPGLYVPPLSFAAWKKALTSPALLLVFLVTLLSFSGQFSMFGYIAPILRDGFGASPGVISLMFAIVGVAGVVGNSLASRLAGQIKVETIIFAALLSLCAGFLGFGLFWGSIVMAGIFGSFWGLGSFSSNSLQQSRLVSLAPALAGATIALNTSVVYLGQSVGSAVGGWLVDGGMMRYAPLASLTFMGCAVVLSLLASRVAKTTQI